MFTNECIRDKDNSPFNTVKKPVLFIFARKYGTMAKIPSGSSMNMNKHGKKERTPGTSDLEKIWKQVPPDYYQTGVTKNLLQKIWHQGKVKAIVDLMDPTTTKKKILDIGCASGWLLNEIVTRFTSMQGIGVDVYKDAIDYGNAKYPHLKLQVADGHSLPFPDNSVNIIVCSEVLEHVLSPQTVLSEMKRVLKPDGYAIIEMDSGNALFKIVWYWWTNIRHGVWEDAHIQKFNANKLMHMIEEAGFTIVETKRFNFTMAVAYRTIK